MRPFHYVFLGFGAVVGAKIIRGLLSGWFQVNI